ncbi:ArnT family glycosyltransferase [Pseudarthrobacter enclensis]|uniref:ArnT family glycosyltransferase n=1 Tax=Pseudarthrobacter enclensis TaxID=993070 RepID=UPI003EDEAAED
MLYFWDLGINGWANYYYSAAVQSGAIDFKAFFYGSSDWGNSITVDKPPLSLWLMGLSVRVFGFHPLAVLLPQAILGVATTLLIYKILRKCLSAAPALFGATVFFTTPIITLMSRYNNPDPLMIFLMVCAAWCVIKCVESGQSRYFVLTGAVLGLAFMTKQLQGLLSLPAVGLSYFACSPQTWLQKLRSTGLGLLALAATGGAWATAVDLIPSEQRPFVGGSSGNSVLQLTLGYNGIDRVTGSQDDPTVSLLPEQFRSIDSDAGIFRLLNANYSQEAGWLLFGSLLAAALLTTLTLSKALSLQKRALIVLSAVWLITAFLLLSFMGNQIHTYYTASLAAPLALTLGLAADELIRRRNSGLARLLGSSVGLVALLTSWLILKGTVGWPNWLPALLLGVGVAALSALAVKPPIPLLEKVGAATLAASLLAGPALTSVHNVTIAFNGSNPLSGQLTTNPAGISHLIHSLKNNDPRWAHDIAFGREPDHDLVRVLASTHTCRWAAVSYASQTAARLQLESGRPVMPLGGFAGSDPYPTLADFKKKVAAGDICYMVKQEDYLDVHPPGTTLAAIAAWVADNYAAEAVGNTTVYRLKSLEQGTM